MEKGAGTRRYENGKPTSLVCHVKACEGSIQTCQKRRSILSWVRSSLNCTQYTKRPFCPPCSPVSCSEETDAATNKTNGTFLQTLLESMSFSSLRPRECTEVRRTPRGAFLPSHSSTANAQEKQRNSNLSRASTVSMTWLHRPAYLTLMQTVRLVRFLAVSA